MVRLLFRLFDVFFFLIVGSRSERWDSKDCADVWKKAFGFQVAAQSCAEIAGIS
jgi:hypothetical protein